MRRKDNQDAVLVEQLQAGPDAGEAYLVAVADGVGGGPGGATASRQALDSLSETVEAKVPGSPSEALRRGFHLANERVLHIAAEQPGLTGMASTLTAAIILSRKVWLANTGDSRAYLVRDGSAWPVTYDHSWVAEEVEAGRMTQDQAARDPRRNLITRAIGAEAELEPDIYKPLDMQEDDALVLCSDGLYGPVHDADIASLCSELSPDEAVVQLIALANERGGPDNISVVIVRVSGSDGQTPADEQDTVSVPLQ
jgi:protein phosphatase